MLLKRGYKVKGVHILNKVQVLLKKVKRSFRMVLQARPKDKSPLGIEKEMRITLVSVNTETRFSLLSKWIVIVK